MSFEDLVTAAKQDFPDLSIKYKDQSSFMKFLGFLLHFINPGFMTNYSTTIGSTIYFPNAAVVKVRQVSSSVTLLHELVHVHDAKRISKFLFGFLYLSPQIWALLCLPLFLISWKLALPLMVLFLCPIPAYFRMYFEKRAYLASLYSINLLSKRLNFSVTLGSQENSYLGHFKDTTYYFMWPFSNLKKDFDDGLAKIEAGQRPYEDPIFDIIDKLAETV